MNKYIIAALLCTIALTGCDQDRKNYDAAAYCQGQGMKPGDPGYDKCVRDEESGELMDQQQKEFDNMKRQQQDYRMQPNNGAGYGR